MRKKSVKQGFDKFVSLIFNAVQLNWPYAMGPVINLV